MIRKRSGGTSTDPAEGKIELSAGGVPQLLGLHEDAVEVEDHSLDLAHARAFTLWPS